MQEQEFRTKLDRLARLCVTFGLNVQPGQELIVTAPLEAAPFVRAVANHAYAAGASHVTPFYSDDALTLSRFDHARSEAFDHAPGWLYEGMAQSLRAGAARLAVYAETPGLLDGKDPDRVARANHSRARAAQPFKEAITSNVTNWNVISYVTDGWATRVFADLPVEEARSRLWDEIFRATRVDGPDPVAAWERHLAILDARIATLQALNLAELHFRDGETDLHVGLARGHVWKGGRITSNSGIRFAPNLPTEEVFTMPDRRSTRGRARFTKPVDLAGSLIEDLVVDFAQGRAVSISAGKGQKTFEKHLATDEGAARLGEVALVPHSSPISASGVLFMNTLFDENAACHVAFGNSYSMNLHPDQDGETAGANTSQIHNDCMIGSASMDVDGIDAAGGTTPIMRDGEFVI